MKIECTERFLFGAKTRSQQIDTPVMLELGAKIKIQGGRVYKEARFLKASSEDATLMVLGNPKGFTIKTLAYNDTVMSTRNLRDKLTGFSKTYTLKPS